MSRAIARYRVEICGGKAGQPIEVEHMFSCKAKAEAFAKRIAVTLEMAGYKRDGFNGPEAWVLVYALCDGSTFQSWLARGGICYLSFDCGGAEAKRHAIPAGYYGHVPSAIVKAERARMRAEGWRWSRKAGAWQYRGTESAEVAS